MKLINKLFALTLFWGTLAACDTDILPANGYIETTQQDASTFVLQGYEDVRKGFNVFTPQGVSLSFYLKDKTLYGSHFYFLQDGSSRLDAMTLAPEEGAWSNTAEVAAGKCYWVRYGEYAVFNYIKLRVAYIEGNNVGMEYVQTEQTSAGPNMNANVNYQGEYPSALHLEIPAINVADGIYREHYVDYNGQHVMNLATSWNAELRHSRWVAFYFDKLTSQDNVKRTDAWSWDKEYDFDSMGGVEEAMHKNDGYDKGHLCASEDRVYCKEANEQTFYYTNISPQIGSFNQKYWMYLEQQVQKWGRSTQQGTYDKVYVTKGGTLNKLLTNFTGTLKGGDGKYPETDAEGFTIHGLSVPAYYYMAVLAEKDGKYSAIAFYVPHSELLPQKPTAGDFQVYAVTIDKLEQETGIDFFCNLPDVIEREVESTYNVADWAW